MRKLKIFLVMLLCTCLFAGSIELPVLATEADVSAQDGAAETFTDIMVNPLYADWITEEEIAAWAESVSVSDTFVNATSEALSREEAVDALTAGLVAREEEVVVTVQYETIPTNPWNELYAILDESMEDDAESLGYEGDYIKFHYRGGQIGYSSNANKNTVSYQFLFSYLTTPEQEVAVTEKLEEVYESLELDSLGREAKIGKIYDYVTNHITYDYAHLEDGISAYPIAWSAYGGLIDGTCVCQGYSTLTYRMMKENGIPARVITGYSGGAHGWNIVEIDGLFYNIDSTWDGYTVDENGNMATPGGREWYLLSQADFGNHVRDEEYNTTEFHLKYPMAALSYGKSDIGGEENTYPEQNNPEYQFTTTTGGSVSTTANAGECTILVIGRATCYNTRNYLNLLKASGLPSNKSIRVIMIDIDQTMETIQSLEEELDCADITYAYGAEGDVGSSALWVYARKGGHTGGTLTFPVVALIDGNNKVRYAEVTAKSLEGAKACLRYIFNYSSPAITGSDISVGSVGITWSGVENAERYHVYCKVKEGAEFREIGTTAETAYQFKPTGNGKYSFAVSAEIGGIESKLSEPVVVTYETGGIREVVLDFSSLLLFRYEDTTLTASVFPVLKGDTIDTSVSWSSSDETIVTVNNGQIMGIKPGTAVITATSVKDATKKATCSVTVKNDYKISYELNGGTLKDANPTDYNPFYPDLVLYSPEKTGYSFVGWYRDKDFAENTRMEKIPTGSDFGNFTLYAKWLAFESPQISESQATKEGITIRWNEIAKADSYNVYRKKKTESNYTKLGNTTETTYQDPITAAGTYLYVVTAEYDGVESAYSPEVEIQYAYGAVKEVTLNHKEAEIFAYEELSLEATVSPVMSDDSVAQDVIWTSSDDEIASVKDGKITGVKAGSAVITATSVKDATKKATCMITVKKDYTIRYELHGGTLLETNPAAYNPFYPDLVLHAPVKDDCSFLGWYRDAAFAEESKIEGIPTGTDLGDLVLYANWKEKMGVLAPSANVADGSEVEKGTKVRLSTETLDATIYYTLDGTTPTRNSTVYTDAIVVNKNVLILAFAVKEGLKDSPVATFHYTVRDDSKDLGEVLPEDVPENGMIPEGLWVAGVEDVVYDGSAVVFDLNVYHGKKMLDAGTDYTVSYKNNKLAAKADAKKAPAVIVTGKGNYKDKIVKNFTIAPMNIEDSPAFFAENVSVPYNGKIQKPVPTVYFNSTKLKVKKDFILQYNDVSADAYKEVGTYEIIVEGTGNYCGSLKSMLTISQVKQASKLKVTAIPAQPYTGAAITPSVEVKDGKTVVDASQYTVLYRNNVEVGTASVRIIGDGIHYAGVKTVTFKITGHALSKAKLQDFATSVPYTGKVLKQDSVKLTYSAKGQPLEILVENKDYTVKYMNNKKVGTATVLFTGIGKYTGTLKKTFKITPYDIKANANGTFTVSYQEEVPYAKGGAKTQPVVKFDGKLLTEGRDYTVSYKNNKALHDGSGSAKVPVMIIKGKGSFKSSISLQYQIVKQNFARMEIRSADKAVTTKKGAFISVPKIYDLDGKLLKAGVDYEKNINYVYDEDTVLADGTLRTEGSVLEKGDVLPLGCVIRVEVTGKGNYTSVTAYGKYRVVKADISKATVKVSPQAYTGKAVEPGKDQINITVKGVKLSPSDYEIVSYANNVKKGKATVVLRGVGNYGGIKTVKFSITAKTVKNTEFYNY
ncbi:MAG: hypothetical protein E7288_00875 [Lachnospiraceae bacterium]|nr:hypothetical protein [Lachnospiraceae bacterium]